MAKKKRVIKAQVIREYAKEHNGEGPTEMANAINAQGVVSVTPQQVSTTLNNDRKKEEEEKNGAKPKRKGRKPKKVAVRSKASSTASVSSDDLFKARQLASQLGGVAKAKAAFDALSQLQD